MTAENWNAFITTNLPSCFNMCRAVINPMREKHFGRIVSISSVNGQLGQAWQTNTPTKDGSWWEAWQSWINKHSSDKIKPPSMGSKEYAPIQDAPGSYVMMK